MKIYIVTDMEGLPGATTWDDVDPTHPNHAHFAKLLTQQVTEAYHGAIAGGATEVWVNDWHNVGLNIHPAGLPKDVRLIRGSNWIAPCLNETFDGLAFIGMHSEMGHGCSPLAHTVTRNIAFIKVDGEVYGEYELIRRYANCFGVPLIYASGDSGVVQRFGGDVDIKVAVSKLKPRADRSRDFGGSVEVEVGYTDGTTHKAVYSNYLEAVTSLRFLMK